MRNGPLRAASVLARAAILACSVGLTAAPALAVPADSADDICPVNQNPCSVTQSYEIVDGSVLDFYNRAIVVSGSGKFDFAAGSGQILCGDFTANTTNPALDANGPAPGGGTSSGAVTIQARRLCTGGNPKVPCIDINDCQIGTCGVRRCTLRPGRLCDEEGDCKLGNCVNRRCSGSVSFVRCTTNADCDYGSCPLQLTCSDKAVNPVNCAVNADCDFGTCTTGTASVNMGGSIVGNSNSPASITIRAADSISISKLVNLSSGSADADGGDLTLDAAAGSVTITGRFNLRGGGLSQGGTLEVIAGQDVTFNEDVDAVGGDFDGGSIDIEAGRDIFLNDDLIANAATGAGFGGEIVLEAGQDIFVTGVSAANRTTLETTGSTDAENFAGDGGTQDFAAGRNMTLGQNTRIIGNGSQPDGFGSDVFFEVGGDLTFLGDVIAKALGGDGSGGYVETLTLGALIVGGTGTFDVTGGSGGGGLMEMESEGNVSFGGTADASASNTGSGGSVYIDSNSDMTISGVLKMTATDPGSLEVDACRVTLTGTGKLENKSGAGNNGITARESMRLLAGSAMTTVEGGPNRLRYRTAAKPPQIAGMVSPAPQLIVDGNLVGCPVCGNSEIDQGETCDDGNVKNGDGCSSTCQNENCLAQTIAPGFPAVALCEDGDACTADVCNTTLNGGTCQHPPKNCSDGIACTADSCNPENGNCLNVPVDSACNDGNPCTDDFCSAATGCFDVANNDPCNDGDVCTENDTCAAKQCSGSVIGGCGVCGDGNVNPPEQCDDGNATFTVGEYCGVGCTLVPCGKPTNQAGDLPKSSDALFVLRAAVGQTMCSVYVCDVDSNTSVLSSDALRVLRAAVGQTVVLNCPMLA